MAQGGILKYQTGGTFDEWFNSIPENNRSSNYDYQMAFNMLNKYDPELL